MIYFVTFVILGMFALSFWHRRIHRHRHGVILTHMFNVGQNIGIVLTESYPSAPTAIIPIGNYKPTATDSNGAYSLSQTTTTKDYSVNGVDVPTGSVIYVIPSPPAADTVTVDYGTVVDMEGGDVTIGNDVVEFTATNPGTVASNLFVL